MPLTVRLALAFVLVAALATALAGLAVRTTLGSAVDREILEGGGVAIGVALVLGILIGRSIAKPIEELSKGAREVLTGEPRPVKRGGTKEVRELADTINHTIEELARIKKRLAATERIAARREIARQVAHEIKNPLAPIRAAVETLRRLRGRNDAAFDDYFDEATKTVLEEVHRIANIVSEFTKFSRLPPPNLEQVNVVSVAKRVVALHAADPEAVRTGAGNPAETGRVELVADDVPEIRADRDQLVQVLTNLVANGLDAAAAVRKDPRVNVTIGRAGEGKVRIVVRDNGPGVADEMRDKLFEPYATTKAHGTGLGLAICQRIVVEHGGEITYRPATKGGAVFETTLPIAGPTVLEQSMEISQSPTGAALRTPLPDVAGAKQRES